MALCPNGHADQNGSFCSACGAPLTAPTQPGPQFAFPTQAGPPAATGDRPGQVPPPADWSMGPDGEPARDGSPGGPHSGAHGYAATPGAGQTAVTPPVPATWTGLLGRLTALPRTALIGGAAALVLLAGTAVFATGLGSEDTHTISGTFTLFDGDDIDGDDATDCEGTGGYSDVSAGVKVTVRNESDKIVGSGTLRNGSSVQEVAEAVAAQEGNSVEEVFPVVAMMPELACTLLFDVDVEKAKHYDIEVGRRGKISSSFEQMEQDNWRVAFSLGN